MTDEEIIAKVVDVAGLPAADVEKAVRVSDYLRRRASMTSPAPPGSYGGEARIQIDPDDLDREARILEESQAEFWERVAEPLRTLRELTGAL